VLTNDPALNIRLARAGAGLSLADDRMREYVAALRALVDYLRRKRSDNRARKKR
jgi:hypothetical protein